MKRLFAFLVILFVLTQVEAAQAQTVTISQPQSNSGAFNGVSDTVTTSGQTVLVPAGVARLQSFTLNIRGDATPVVRAYDNATSTIGPILFTGTPYSGLQSDVVTTIPGGVAVTPGSHVLIGIAQTSPGIFGEMAATTDVYADGLAAVILLGSTRTIPSRDVTFSATFDQAIAAVAVPTLSEMALFMLGLGLAGAATFALRRRRGIA